MIEHRTLGSQSFRLAALGLLALHRLGKDGKDDSPEAESVRDSLDVPLGALNRVEKQRAQWLSEDLYSVSEPPEVPTQKEMNSQAQQQLNEAIEAKQSREWDRALALLRRWKDYIAPALLSYLRGSIWFEARFPEVAAMFFGHASELAPENSNYRAIYMHALSESDLDAARKLARSVLAAHEIHAPITVAIAANIRFNEVRGSMDAAAVQFYREMIPILIRNQAKIEQDESVSSHNAAYAMTANLLGSCYELQGDAGAAVDCYTHAIQKNPDDDAMLVARGILLYGKSPRAITDLERAAELDHPLLWPYLFLAHHHLMMNQFDLCRLMCERGLRRRGSDTAKSQLEEWRAIAQAELGFPAELVRQAFEAAVHLDPSNESAKSNQAVFEAFLRSPHTPPRLNWRQKSEADIRLYGMAEHQTLFAA